MRQILYVSHAARDIAAGQIDGILTASRRNNAALGVTGLLLHVEGGFLQMLEGEESTLRELYARICADRRHARARVMLEREVPRAFPGWSMAFEPLRGDDPETAGLCGMAREAVAGRLSPGAGRVVASMLEAFYRMQADEADLRRRA